MKKYTPLKYAILILILFAIDQVTKTLVQNANAHFAIIEDVLRVDYTLNDGLVFGFFSGVTATHTLLLALFAVVALSIFTYLLLKTDFKDPRTKWYAIGLSLLIAGTLGNSYDRLFRDGHQVVDFINFIAFPNVWYFPFNFADVFLNVGLGFFFIDVFFLEKKRVVKHG
jgi:signal peptidase II